MAKIFFTAGTLAGRTLELPPTGLVIGKTKDADLVMDDPSVSGHHARMTVQNGIWRIQDLQSTNGTNVNGNKIEAADLNNGDEVSMGDVVFIFKADGAGAGAASAAATDAKPSASPAAVASTEDVLLVQQMKDRTDAIRREVGKVIVGQREVLDQVLMCMIASGHALLIGLPGMAKTLMVSTIAKVLDMKFKRVQFTPDLMPADIIGSDVLETDRDTGEKSFRFITGPLFCNLLLADEINRTPPKTQAALLEAMQEKHVTAGNTTYPLDRPFFVLATQNPIEQEGTYPLPEAQLDRFMFNIWVDYPESHEEEQIVGTTTSGTPALPERILSREQVIQLQEVVKKIPVSPHVIKYVIRLVRATRPGVEGAPEVTKKYISTGAGPRAGQYLVLAAKARAVLEGRIHVSCNDIRSAAIPVLRHRLLTNFAADSEGLTSMSIIKQLLELVKEPGEQEYTAPEQQSKKAPPQKSKK